MFKNWLAYLFLLLCAAVVHVFLVDYLSLFILAFFLLLPLCSLLLAIPAARGVTAAIELCGAASEKSEAIPLRVTVRNTSRFPAGRVWVRFLLENEFTGQQLREVLSLSSCSKKQTVEHTVSSQYCGRLLCRIDNLRVYDCLGLFSFRRKPEQKPGGKLLVLPELRPLALATATSAAADAESEDFSPLKSGSDPSEIFAIREFQDGDRLRSIHWKLTDKTGRLMVKEFSLPLSCSVLLLFDLNGSAEEADAVVEIAASLSSFLLDSGLPHAVEWYDTRSGQALRSKIMQEDDLAATLNAILNESCIQTEPLALEHCNSGDGTRDIPHAVYLCSRLPTEQLALFCDRPAGSRTSILLVSNDTPPQEQAQNFQSLGAALITVRPQLLEQDLRGFEL